MADTTYWDRLALAMGLRENSPDMERREAVNRLARKMGLSYQAIDKYRRGTSGSMSAENNLRAAQHLKVNPDWLASGEGDMRDPSRSWPFGAELSPADFYLLTPEDIRPALDVLIAAVARRREANSEAA